MVGQSESNDTNSVFTIAGRRKSKDPVLTIVGRSGSNGPLSLIADRWKSTMTDRTPTIRILRSLTDRNPTILFLRLLVNRTPIILLYRSPIGIQLSLFFRLVDGRSEFHDLFWAIVASRPLADRNQTIQFLLRSFVDRNPTVHLLRSLADRSPVILYDRWPIGIQRYVFTIVGPSESNDTDP